MRRLIVFISILFIIYASWPALEKGLANTEYKPVIDRINSEVAAIKDNPGVSAAIESLYEGITNLAGQLNMQLPLQQKQPQPDDVKKPDLAAPAGHTFSIHNIELGDIKNDVEQQIGAPKRSSFNEYGIPWHAYHENYQSFTMVGYDKHNKVAGLYTNQDLIAASNNIKLGSSKQAVLEQLGEPLTRIQKGMVYYQLQENRDYDIFLVDGSYVTIFYDKHKNNTVTAMQIIRKDIEQNKQGFYAEASDPLKEGFEYQLFDLTNASRVNNNLPVLTWDDHVKNTARKHSIDMAENQYFNHTNLEGQSPFDRMKEDDIRFSVAGENLAYGQFSSVFAHEGLMNSIGHRENILRPDFELLGVGVAFNSKSQPYFTENFYTKRAF
ncbi:CAP domain-containing protein [Bacillus sp. T33-2]|uniref:CAP domain-containing protein n=1 Tax=Bacillus sp. T33-2 TaxID=2054168 RepID=UPI000C789D3B|nr:CAP domain-containing protein [Bacillus sp. T33-2]PLR89858.1 serine protease [Bacillus sp. T33-2]